VGAHEDTVPLSLYLAAARDHSGGAFPVLTRRPVHVVDGRASGGTAEDVVTRLEPLERFPQELASVPEGLRRSPHPLELMVSHAEDEADLRAGVPPGSGGGR